MKRKIAALTLLLLGLLVVGAGCLAVAAGAGAGTYAFVKGDLETVEKENVAQVYNAALQALEDLQIPVQNQQQDDLVALIEGRTAEDKKVTIKIEATENNLSKLSIRIGTFGDSDKSKIIYDKIKEYL